MLVSCFAYQNGRKIAEIKMPDLNTESIDSAMAMIAGAARSMGLEVKD